MRSNVFEGYKILILHKSNQFCPNFAQILPKLCPKKCPRVCGCIPSCSYGTEYVLSSKLIARVGFQSYAVFALNGFDDQERNPTFVKTYFQVLKHKFYACN